MTEHAVTPAAPAVEEALERLELGPVEALALQSGARAIFARGEVRSARLIEGADRTSLILDLPDATERAVARWTVGLPSLSVTTRAKTGGGVEVTLAVPRGAGPRRASPQWERVTELLRREATRAAELERMRDELDETNRGVVALYAELDDHSRRLELADRRKNEFLAMLAHELRNPLAALHLAAEDLVSDCEPGPSSRSADVMQRQLVHLSRMVDDLLDVSRITRGKVEITAERMDLSGAVREAVFPRVPIAADAGLTLALHTPDEPVWIEGDVTRIEQVVVNLVDNAIKYSGGSERIDVRVEPDEDEVEVTVRDRGRGMTADEIRDAFELFVQHGTDELDRSRGGLGIGLTLVREIVAMHHGQVSATSEGAGRGTTVRVRLPRVEPPPDAVATDPEEPADDARLHVLLVEDNEDFRELLAARLRLRGCEVEEAADGVEALDRLVREAKPDLVLTDVGLPHMDGYALVKAIRADPRLRDLRVVALTGYGGAAAGERTREAGFDAHLVKPVPMDHLMRVIRSSTP